MIVKLFFTSFIYFASTILGHIGMYICSQEVCRTRSLYVIEKKFRTPSSSLTSSKNIFPNSHRPVFALVSSHLRTFALAVPSTSHSLFLPLIFIWQILLTIKFQFKCQRFFPDIPTKKIIMFFPSPPNYSLLHFSK